MENTWYPMLKMFDQENYLHKKGFTEIHIKWTEREMGINPSRAADNNCTPKDMARLLEWFYKNKGQNEYLGFVWEIMANCQTGNAKMNFGHDTPHSMLSDYHEQDWMTNMTVIIRLI